MFLSEASVAAYLPLFPHLFGIYQTVHQQLGSYRGNITRRLADFKVQSAFEGRNRPRSGSVLEKEMANLIRETE